MNARPTIGVVIFTIVEVAALVGWLLLADRGLAAVGIAVLFVGLVLEHILTDIELHRQPPPSLTTPIPALEIVAFSGLETAIWAGWLVLWTLISPIGATIFLVLALLVEHTVSRNVHLRLGLFESLVDAVTIPHTVVEVVGCTGWLVLVRAGQPLAGVGFLFALSLAEHTIAVSRTRV